MYFHKQQEIVGSSLKVLWPPIMLEVHKVMLSAVPHSPLSDAHSESTQLKQYDETLTAKTYDAPPNYSSNFLTTQITPGCCNKTYFWSHVFSLDINGNVTYIHTTPEYLAKFVKFRYNNQWPMSLCLQYSINSWVQIFQWPTKPWQLHS